MTWADDYEKFSIGNQRKSDSQRDFRKAIFKALFLGIWPVLFSMPG
jgi:hypothetical protein